MAVQTFYNPTRKTSNLSLASVHGGLYLLYLLWEYIMAVNLEVKPYMVELLLASAVCTFPLNYDTHQYPKYPSFQSSSSPSPTVMSLRDTLLSQECPLPYVTAFTPLSIHQPQITLQSHTAADTAVLCMCRAMIQSCWKSRGALNPAGLAHRVITLAFLPCTPQPKVTQPQRITSNAFNRYQRPSAAKCYKIQPANNQRGSLFHG